MSDGLDKVIYNRGIGGTTTDDFLAEIDTVLFDLRPSKIFINIGSNDFAERADGMKTEYRKHYWEANKKRLFIAEFICAYYL